MGETQLENQFPIGPKDYSANEAFTVLCVIS